LGYGIFSRIFVSLFLIYGVAIFVCFYVKASKLDLLVLVALIDKLVFIHSDGVRLGKLRSASDLRIQPCPPRFFKVMRLNPPTSDVVVGK
jgi:hypothetical protein